MNLVKYTFRAMLLIFTDSQCNVCHMINKELKFSDVSVLPVSLENSVPFPTSGLQPLKKSVSVSRVPSKSLGSKYPIKRLKHILWVLSKLAMMAIACNSLYHQISMQFICLAQQILTTELQGKIFTDSIAGIIS